MCASVAPCRRRGGRGGMPHAGARHPPARPSRPRARGWGSGRSASGAEGCARSIARSRSGWGAWHRAPAPVRGPQTRGRESLGERGTRRSERRPRRRRDRRAAAPRRPRPRRPPGPRSRSSTARPSTIASLSGKKRYTDPIDTPATSARWVVVKASGRRRRAPGRCVEHAAQSLAAARLHGRVAKAMRETSPRFELENGSPSRNHLDRHCQGCSSGTRARRRGGAQLGSGRTRDRDRRQFVRARRRARRIAADRRTAGAPPRRSPSSISTASRSPATSAPSCCRAATAPRMLPRRHAAGAVVHSHSRFATALACVLDELPVVHYQEILR